MIKKIAEMSTGELAALVSLHLKKHDIEVVLSGDSCVSIYTDDAYQADDLDFIEVGAVGKKRLEEVLALIGFMPAGKNSRHFAHPDAKLTVEFPTGPLMVGEEPPSEITKLTFDTGKLFLLSPTDCVKDRLLWFFNDPNRNADHPSLTQAQMVSREQDVDFQEIESWAKKECEPGTFQQVVIAIGVSSR